MRKMSSGPARPIIAETDKKVFNAAFYGIWGYRWS